MTAQPSLIKNNLERRRGTDRSLCYKIHKAERNASFSLFDCSRGALDEVRAEINTFSSDRENKRSVLKNAADGRQMLYLEVSVDDESVVHVLQAQDDLCSIKAHILLAEDPVL